MLMWILLAVVLVYGVLTYNSLVAVRNHVEKAWANIDVLLKQRNDELPKLIDTCKAYMTHEAQTLERVISARLGLDAARKNQDIAGLAVAEASLQSGLGQLFAIAENYPDLKANQTFAMLQQRITGLENQIADRREFYNESVNINNVRIAQFPDVIVAKLMQFDRKNMLTFSKDALKDVDVSARFNQG